MHACVKVHEIKNKQCIYKIEIKLEIIVRNKTFNEMQKEVEDQELEYSNYFMITCNLLRHKNSYITRNFMYI